MSASQMLDMCVNYIARRHHMLTDEHVALLDEIWDLYDPLEAYSAQDIPLPPSPPPERQHIYFDEGPEENTWGDQNYSYPEPSDEELQRQDEEEQEAKALRRWEEQERKEHEQEQQLDALWRQVAQEGPVSASMQETCPCEACEWQDRRLNQPTCDPDGCTYECGTACGAAADYPKPPLDSCLYGCAFTCGAKPGEDCIAEFDEEGDQLPALVSNVTTSVLESDNEMPGLVYSYRIYPKGSMNPEEAEETETETEIVSPQPATPLKAKATFPYSHHYWPSPRAKVLVRSILGSRASKVLGVKTLTHEACMRWLAEYYGLSPEQLLATSIFDLHNRERVAWTRDSPKPYMGLPPICSCCYCKNSRYSR